MIETQLEYLKNDLEEVLTAFGVSNDIKIKHLFQKTENKLVNTIVINGKSYAYGNLIHYFGDETVEKRLIKRFSKLSLYKALSLYLNKSLPWGSLTGIRPTKLAYSLIEENGEFADYFINTLKVSEEKTSLTEKIIQTQRGIYEKNPDNTDFFIFIPFCPSRCSYCSFISQDIKSARDHIDEYIDTLVYEIKESAKLIRKLRSIYIGGGTPVALSDKQLERILYEVDKINTGVEFTVEAGRPDRITKENLKLLKKYNVTRICINPQTFNDKTLQSIGRFHTANDIIEKYQMAKDDFIVNMDLIAGLQSETFDDFSYSINKAIELDPDNITIHTLSIKKGSYLAEQTSRLSDNDISKMIDYAHDMLIKKGYNPYYLYRQKYMAGNLENTGYSKPHKECVYNVDVMEEISQNIANGSCAISKWTSDDFTRIERVASPKDVPTYINKIDKIIIEKQKLFNNNK